MKRREPYNQEGHPVMSAIFVAGIVVCGVFLYTKNKAEKSIKVFGPTKREAKDGKRSSQI